jgi:hypothetical protein
VAARVRAEDGAGPAGLAVIGATTPRFDGISAAILALESAPDGFFIDPIPADTEARDPDDGLAALLSLGGPLRDRLAATVAAAWRDRLRAGTAQPELPRLEAALYGRALAALRGWTGRPDLRLELTMTGEDQPPALAGDTAVIRAELPFGWLVEV